MINLAKIKERIELIYKKVFSFKEGGNFKEQTKFYVEKPMDKDHNRFYTLAVIEGGVGEGKHGEAIKVISPEGFAHKWSTVYPSLFQEVDSSVGPARLINDVRTLDRIIGDYKV